MRDFQLPGRSIIYGTEFMVATPHPLATSAAIEMMHSGGNAVDAAVAAMAALCVVDPAQVGLGGDCFALLCPKGGGDVIALDGAGTAPAAASRDWYFSNGFSSVPEFGAHSVSVPGIVHGLERLVTDHGGLGLERVLQPAIRLAENGHAVHERVAFDWSAQTGKLGKHSASKAVFLPHGNSPDAGQLFKNPALALALRDIAKQGAKVFYEGWIADDLVQNSPRRGRSSRDLGFRSVQLPLCYARVVVL